MSSQLIPIITCDGTVGSEVCLEETGGDPAMSLSQARELAAADGWSLPATDRDLCPIHTTTAAAPTAQASHTVGGNQ